MEFFLEMIPMVIVSLLISFLVAKLVSLSMAVHDLAENPEIVGVGDDFVKEEVDSSFKMDSPVVGSERHYLDVVDQNVESVDPFDEENGKNSVNSQVSAEGVVKPETIVGEEDERMEEVTVPENVVSAEMMIRSCLESEESEEELRIEEEDDDWEGIERSEVEKAFVAAANYVEGEEVEISAEAKMELYGLHKIATQGPCREAPPMAFMVSARARWSAWHKLGNMNQEEAMEKYLALVSKELPGWTNTVHTSVVLHPNSGSLQDPTTSATTCAASAQNV